MEGCIFCKIVNGEIPSKQLYEDDFIIAIMDINPRCDGHTLIIPKEHFEDYTKLDETTFEHIMLKAELLAKSICEKLDCEGYSLVINYGSLQDVKHFHLHILPDSGKKLHEVDAVYDKLTK